MRQSKGFTLIEIAIALVIIGLLIGLGASLIGPLTKRAKITETKDILNAAVESVIGFAATNNRLPKNEPQPPNNEFPQIVRNPNDAWSKPLIYFFDSDLTSSTSPSNPAEGICARKTTNLIVCIDANCNNQIQDVAFIVVSGGLNYNVQTGSTSCSTGKTCYKVYPQDTPNVDDYSGDFTRQEEYDDIVKWVTLDELRTKMACTGAQMKIITTELPYGIQGTPYKSTIYAEGGILPITWSNNLNAPGLSFISSDREYTLSGTPQCPGAYSFTLTATDSLSNNASRSYVLNIQPDPLKLNPVPGTTWYAYNQTLFPDTTIMVSGGRAPYMSNCVITPPICSDFLSCSASGGSVTISGTPNISGNSSVTCTIAVNSSDSCDGTSKQNISGNYYVVIHPSSNSTTCPALSLNPPSGTTWNATSGQQFSQSITVSGGQTPLTNTQCTPSTCNGLSMNCTPAGATVSGTPNASGSCIFNVGWEDSCTSPGKQTISGTYQVSINCPSLSLSPPNGTSWNATIGQSFSQSITLFGGQTPLTNTQCTPSSCKGLSLSCSSSSATISGTPNSQGTCTFNASWNDSCNPAQTISGTYHVYIGGSLCPVLKLDPPSGTKWWAIVHQHDLDPITITVLGGLPPLTNTQCTPQNCRGLKLSCTSSDATISKAGALSSEGVCTFNVAWQDSCNPPQTVSGTYKVYICPTNSVDCGTCLCAYPNTCCPQLEADSPCCKCQSACPW